MLTRNPTAKRTLQTTPRLHRRVTCNNTPGILPVPNVITPTPTLNATTPCRTQPIATTRIQPCRKARVAHSAIPGRAQQRIVMQHAINILTLRKQASFSTIHPPCALMKHAKMRVNMEHCANPMVHPVTGCTISSYKKLMHNPATAKVWQTAFGKDFLEAWRKVATKLAKKERTQCLSWHMIKSGMLSQPRKFSHMRILSWITDRKKMIPTASESQRETIRLIMMAMPPFARPTLTLQNSTGTA
jgi:hypothetical protein